MTGGPTALAGQQEDRTTPFDRVPRSAPEVVKGAAFASAMILRQADAGIPAAEIKARHDAAVAALSASARNDGEREFLAGFSGISAQEYAAEREAG